jgi:hypothetical protein
MNRISFTLMTSILLLSGCSTPEGTFPSLAKRPFETQTAAPDPIPEPVPAPTILPTAVAAKVDVLMTRHKKAQAAYNAVLPQVQNIARNAANSPLGSEAWVNAQLEVSRLDKARADSVAAQGEFDQLVIEQDDVASTNDTPSLTGLLAPYQAEIASAVTAQSAEIDRLSKLIGE